MYVVLLFRFDNIWRRECSRERGDISFVLCKEKSIHFVLLYMQCEVEVDSSSTMIM